MIKPLSPCLEVTYQHHWKKRASAVDIGHRGMGTSFFQPEEKQYKKYVSLLLIYVYYSFNNEYYVYC